MKEKQNIHVIKTVALVTALSLLGDSMLYIALPLYWDQVRLESLWQVGVLLSINRFVRLPIAPFVGWLYKRMSLRKGLLVATSIGAITTLGYGLFNGFIAWIILRSLWGVAWSFFRIGGLASVSYYAEDKELGKAMGTYNGLYRLGSLFGMLLGGILVPIIGLKLVAIVFGVLTLLGVPIILYVLKENNAKTVVDNLSETQRSSSQPISYKFKILLICISGFFVTMLIQGVLTATLSSVIAYNQGEFVLIFQFVLSAALLSGLIQSLRWVWEPFLARKIGIWSDGRMDRIPLFVTFLIFTGILYGMISFDLSIITWIVVTLLVMIGATAITTLLDSIAIEQAKTATVTFITLYTIIQDVGAALGPFVSYMVIELESGFSYLYFGGSGILLLLALFWSSFYIKWNKS